MGSIVTNILQRLSGVTHNDTSGLFPSNCDKLTEGFRASEEIDGPGGPLTAREAFELAEELIKGFDPQAQLVRVCSSGALEPSGRCSGWQFRFQLPQRWGYADFDFDIGPSAEELTLELTPFAASGSTLQQMLKDGQEGFVEQQWKVELERNSGLVHSFTDSSTVLKAWKDRGKALDWSAEPVVKAVIPPLGEARWEFFESRSSKKSLYTFPIEG